MQISEMKKENHSSTKNSAVKMGENREACKEAIESAETNGCQLYDCSMDMSYSQDLPEEIFYSMNIRQTVTERFNSELIWSVGKQGTNELQNLSMACIVPSLQQGSGNGQVTGSIFCKAGQQVYMLLHWKLQNNFTVKMECPLTKTKNG